MTILLLHPNTFLPCLLVLNRMTGDDLVRPTNQANLLLDSDTEEVTQDKQGNIDPSCM